MNITVDFDKTIGKIKPMHGVGQPPMDELDASLMHYLAEAGIPYSRLHDTGGAFGGNMFVDISNIFRDFSADETKEESYDFGFTDLLIEKLFENNCKPIYRLGETIENYYYIRAYRIFPPKDFGKWARICEHIIKHYNEGWANGFNYNIEYWEIWNEPDNGRDNTENQMWHGTAEQYYELYNATAKHLKSVFGNKIKIGGCATCGFRHIFSDPEKYGIECEKCTDEAYTGERSANFLRFSEGFLKSVKENNVPLDFFSWHSYLTTDRTVIAASYLDKLLEKHGFSNLETQLNEWNNSCEDKGNPLEIEEMAIKERGTAIAAAKAASMMLAMQNTNTDVLCYYDAGLSVSYYAGMFNPFTREPFPLYYSFKAFNELYKLENQVECICDSGKGIYAVAAGNGNKKAVMICNTSEKDVNITTNISEKMDCYIVDDNKKLEKTQLGISEFLLKKDAVVLFLD